MGEGVLHVVPQDQRGDSPRNGSGLRYILTLTYGPDKTRCMQGMYPPGAAGTEYDVKYYVGNLYDEARSNGRVLRQDYIYADGRLVAIHQTDDRGSACAMSTSTISAPSGP